MAKLPEQLFSEQALREIVRASVRETVQQMKREGLLKRADDVAYSEISSRLFEYFRDPRKYADIGQALEKVRDDQYFPVITGYYQKRMTADELAQMLDCEYTTIMRNKKRLCLQIYLEIEK
jgi:predicted transcriptional regulator